MRALDELLSVRANRYRETNETVRATVRALFLGEPMIVQQTWTHDLPLRMQSLLMLAMRGPDGCQKHAQAKVLLREMRSVVLVPAFPNEPDSFMGLQHGYCDWVEAETFADSHDEYPHHWLMHFVHAAEVVGQFHPDDNIRAFWWNFYVRMCRAFHMHPEGIDELSRRLGDPQAVANGRERL